jgi:hypothetical protein
MLHDLHGSLAGPAPSMHGADTRARSQSSNNTTQLIAMPYAINVRLPPYHHHTAPIPPGLLQSAPGRTKEEGRMENAESGGGLCPAMRENHASEGPGAKPPQSHINATSMRHQCDINATSMRVDSQLIATLKPPQSHPKATPMRPQCVPNASLMRP